MAVAAASPSTSSRPASSSPSPPPSRPQASSPAPSAPSRPDSSRVSTEATTGPGAPRSSNLNGVLGGLRSLNGDAAGEAAASTVAGAATPVAGAPPSSAPPADARPGEPLPTGILSRNFEYGLNWPLGNGGSHQYSTRTAFPEGTSLQEANQLVNGFNAPTARAMNGRPNDPNLTQGWVDNPAFRTSPEWEGIDRSGLVTMERGQHEDGRAWVRNTTVDGLHPMVGTITRSVEEHEGRYYVRTDGVGQGGFMSNTRHKINEMVGPEMFQELDRRMLEYQAQQRGQ